MSTLLASVPGENENFLFGVVCSGRRFMVRYNSNKSKNVEISSSSDESSVQSEISQELEKFGIASPFQANTIVSDPKTTTSNFSALAVILKAADAIGWERVKYLSEDGRTIDFLVTDRCDRSHLIRFTFDTGSCQFAWKTSLPNDLTLNLEETPDIVKIYEHFIRLIEDYHVFWNELDAVDAAAHILEPAKPTYADKWRLIYFDLGVSLRLEVNPFAPRQLPKLELIGSESKCRPHQKLLQEKLTNWDEEMSLTENLMQIFGPFRKPSEMSQRCLKRQYPLEEKDIEEPLKCEICYGSEEPPQATCGNCQRQYHRSCLQECFKRQASKRMTFGSVACKCPHCGQAVSIKLAHAR